MVCIRAGGGAEEEPLLPAAAELETEATGTAVDHRRKIGALETHPRPARRVGDQSLRVQNGDGVAPRAIGEVFGRYLLRPHRAGGHGRRSPDDATEGNAGMV